MTEIQKEVLLLDLSAKVNAMEKAIMKSSLKEDYLEYLKPADVHADAAFRASLLDSLEEGNAHV